MLTEHEPVKSADCVKSGVTVDSEFGDRNEECRDKKDGGDDGEP